MIVAEASAEGVEYRIVIRDMAQGLELIHAMREGVRALAHGERLRLEIPANTGDTSEIPAPMDISALTAKKER